MIAKARRGWGAPALSGAGTAAALLIALFILFRDTGPLRLSLEPVGFDALAGWKLDRVAAAIPAFLKSCSRFLSRPPEARLDPLTLAADFGRVADWARVCREAAALPPGNGSAARAFFESGFTPVLAGDNDHGFGHPHRGLFTGYFAIGLKGSLRRHGRYQVPIYRMPTEPGLAARYTRAEIQDGALRGKHLVIVWAEDPVAAFFLQIQGSGEVRLDDGKTLRLGYAGQNGKPYVAVGRLLLERKVIPLNQLSMAAIWAWMTSHPKAGAALRREDPSFVFFRVLKGPGPKGAEGVVLTPRRSMAVDQSQIPLGVPVWLDARERFPTAHRRLRRLVIAQDVGGAIIGPVRGDLFWGTGKKAGEQAGAMNAYGRYYLLLPRALASRLAASG